MYKKLLLVTIVLLVLLTSVLFVGNAISEDKTFLPVVSKPYEYPVHGWTVHEVYGNHLETKFTMIHPDSYVFTGQCIDPNDPAPPVGASCDLVGNIWYCDGYSQRIIIIIILVTPTPTPTSTPTLTPTPTSTATSTPTELPTDTLVHQETPVCLVVG
jgi:hypothetical protein